MPRFSKILLLAASALLALTVLFGMHASGVAASGDPQQDGAYRQVGVYSEVLRHIQSDYVTDPNIPAVTNGALRGLLESLDADSSYLTPADYQSYKAALAGNKGNAQVGINVSKRFGYATVISVVPGSPAEKANFTDGEIIEAINGKDTRETSLAMIQMALSGAPGSDVTISVVNPRKSDNVPDKIVLSRVLVAAPPVAETLYENSTILYLKPIVLDHDHVSAVEAKLRAGEKVGSKKVLLDLRDVAAGDMGEATRLANFFLASGTIATLEGQKVQKVTYTADSSKTVAATQPLVVLVNRGTAGPGELVAAALLDDKRAELVGEKTFGEGAQTRLFPLQDGAALILSIAKYGTPSGKKLQDDAVTPGILVADPVSDADGTDDDDDSATPTTPSVPAKPTPHIDDQLNKALEMLKAKAA